MPRVSSMPHRYFPLVNEQKLAQWKIRDPNYTITIYERLKYN